MILWVYPSLLAIVAKLALFWLARRNLVKQTSFTVLLTSLFVLNAVEFSSYFRSAAVQPEFYGQYLWMMQLYYIAGAIAAAAIADICLKLVLKDSKRQRQVNGILATTVVLLTIVPGSVITGIDQLGDFVRRVPGPAMAVWTSYVLLAFSGSGLLLSIGVKSASTLIRRQRSCALLLAFVPFIVCSIVVIGLMAMEYPVNGAVTISLTTTLLVITLYVSDSRHRLFRLLSRVPATTEYKNCRQLHRLSDQLKEAAAVPEMQQHIKSIVQGIEAASIGIAVEANEGNVSKTARSVGVSRATIVRKSRNSLNLEDSTADK